MTATILALSVGQPVPFRGEELSAIAKLPVTGKVRIRRLGLEGDAQADPVHHGGPDMAVHHYAHDHYAWWREELGGHPLLDAPAAFGENICASGLTETGVHIGDRFRLGTAVLEVSQPRKPCWKIEHRFGRKGMLRHILARHICGWYYRVIEEGTAQAGDTLTLVEQGHTDWSVARLFAKLLDPATEASVAELHEIAALERLCALWRNEVAKSLGMGQA